MALNFNDFDIATQPRRTLWAPLLLAATVGLAGCPEDEIFEPRGVYSPPNLTFGDVSVASERRLTVMVSNGGSAGLQIQNTTLRNETVAGQFQVSVAEDLLTGLTPGRTSTITVIFRPCPEAWNGNVLDESFMLTNCPGGAANAELVMTDNTVEATVTIPLSGQPVQPPNVEFRCSASRACNMPTGTRSLCGGAMGAGGLSFGQVVAGSGQACDLYLEIVNRKRSVGGNEVSVAPLDVERIDMIVQDFAQSPPSRTDGAEAGFSLLEEDGSPLSLPINIPVPPGESAGSKLVRVRFDGSSSGIFVGSESDGFGLRVTSNDPENPLQTLLLSATGIAPGIEVVPVAFDFGPVQQGMTATATISVRNQGDADLQVSGASIRSGNSEFQVSAGDGMAIDRTLLGGGDRFDLVVTYTPTDPANDLEVLEIMSTDPDDPVVEVSFSGGPTPRFCFEPQRGVLEFPIPDPPTGEARSREVSLQSCGTGNLTITSLNIVNAGNAESVDDFRIDTDAMTGFPECATLPCAVNLELCPADQPDCLVGGNMVGIVKALPIIYQNNDTSLQDLADLIITTNDPRLPEVTITLDASDNPCLPPSGLGLEVVSPVTPCVPSPVVLQVVGQPGGPVGMPSTYANCEFDMVFGTTNIFTPNDSMQACTMTQFVPVAPGGLHLVSVTVTNACGATATSPPEQIQVAPNCN